MRKYYFIPILAIIFFSCRKDPEIKYQASPYFIFYPEIIEKYVPPINMPDDNKLTEEGVALGRKLFYEEKLSANNTQSCGSCHIQSAAFSDTVAFSIGIDGIAGNRNAMPLFNLGWMPYLFWDGRSGDIEHQVFEPINNPVEMHSNWPQVSSKLQADAIYPPLFKAAFGTDIIDSVLVSKAISQFLRTLISGNAPFDKFLLTGKSGWNAADEQMAYEGFTVFLDENKGDCFHCHGDAFNPLWTDNLFHNNGLDASFTDNGRGNVTGNVFDNGKFKTPSLRNLIFTAPYMHDGRFTTLTEVINHYSTGLQNSSTIDPLMKHLPDGGSQMNPIDKQKLLMFLISLSDSSFVVDPRFQDPG